MTPLDYAIVIAFLSVLALAGLWISRLIKDSDDFFVAGRELTPFILAATITATNLSMLHFVGMGGTAWKSGISIAWQNWTGSIALVLSGIVVIPLMRRLRIRSVPEFLELRYSRGLRTIVGAFWGLRLCVFLGILLYIAATAAIIITGCPDTRLNYVLWLLAFSLVSVLYSVIGGAWAVAIMDSVQFLVMLAGALIILPIAAHAAGGMPAVFHYLRQTGRADHLTLVPDSGAFDWLFITSIMLLGFKWASIDQAILQRAFGARSPRVAAKGMVLSAVITIPFVFFWVLPGLAVNKLHPDPFPNPDFAFPWLLATQLPAAARGLLGFVLCGLVAAQVSTITADVNSVATLFTSDVYRTLARKPPSQRQLLLVVRFSSLACGVLMLAAAFLFRDVGIGAIKINLTVVGILDMPLFVVTILYGLLWRRANWQGAVAGFLAGGAVGIVAYLLAPPGHADTVRNLVPILSSATAILVTPVVSLLTAPHARDIAHIWQAFKTPAHPFTEPTTPVGSAPADAPFSGAGCGTLVPLSSSPTTTAVAPAQTTTTTLQEIDDDDFHLIPHTPLGRLALAAVLLGVLTFFAGILSTPLGFPHPAPLALAGLAITLAAGLLRVYTK